MRRLVVQGVMGGVVWVGGGGRRCRAWGPVMGYLVAVAGGGIRGGVCRRGYRRQLAGAGCRVLCPWPGLGGGAGGGGVGVALLVVGGAGVGVVLPMRPAGGGIFFERTSVFERRFESSNEDSNSKIVFALIAIQLNPIESKLLGRIAAKAQQQQRAHQIDRRLPQICARKTQICARKTQICARKKGFFCFFNRFVVFLRVSLFDQWCNLELRSKTR